jgi:hypothetical protein
VERKVSIMQRVEHVRPLSFCVSRALGKTASKSQTKNLDKSRSSFLKHALMEVQQSHALKCGRLEKAEVFRETAKSTMSGGGGGASAAAQATAARPGERPFAATPMYRPRTGWVVDVNQSTLSTPVNCSSTDHRHSVLSLEDILVQCRPNRGSHNRESGFGQEQHLCHRALWQGRTPLCSNAHW